MMIEGAERRLRGVARHPALKFLPMLTLCILLGALIPSSVSATAGVSHVSVSGTHLEAGGSTITFRGFDDTTALEFQMMAYVQGLSTYAGENQNFPYPAGSPPFGEPAQPRLDVSSNAQFWDEYFTLAHHYGFNLVRLGACSAWTLGIDFNCWASDPIAYYNVLGEMLDAAANHSVYVCLLLSGGDTFTFAGTGSAFNVSSSAYAHYIIYADDVMETLAGYDSLAFYDMWNEPDASTHWAHDQVAFRTWARDVANGTAFASALSHLRTMGVGDGGDLAGNFDWGYADFFNCTGGTYFEICQRHVYASAEDAYLFADPQAWADSVGKPYFVGEVARSNVTPIVRWAYAEQQIELNGAAGWCAMVLTGTAGYPANDSLLASLFNAIVQPIITAVLLAAGSVYGVAGLAVGLVLFIGAAITHHWIIALLGLAVIILTLVLVGGLLAL